jgi:hypothetical protein
MLKLPAEVMSLSVCLILLKVNFSRWFKISFSVSPLDYSDEEASEEDSDDEIRQIAKDLDQTPSPTKSALKRDRDNLNMKAKALLEKNHDSSFSIFKFVDKPKKIQSYTGFANYGVFYAFFEFFKEDAKQMHYLGSRVKETEKDREMWLGRTRKLPKIEEFFMVMTRLRKGLDLEVLSDMFNISTSQVSRIINTWLLLMADRLGQLDFWPKTPVEKPLLVPQDQHEKLKNLVVILDGTEIFLQRPSATQAQKETFSSYKNHVTGKMLVGVDGHGTIIFASRVYAGRTSDKKLTTHSGVLDLLKRGDLVMADRGFDIADILKEIGVELMIPDFLKGKAQFTAEELKNSENIAMIRVHVERAIKKIKEFLIFEKKFPINMTPMIDAIWTCCAVLANFTGSGYLVKPKEDADSE